MQEENHKSMMVQRESKQETMTAFAVTTSRMFQAQGDKPTCKHCGKYGHEEEKCFELIGYPTGWVARGGGRGRQRGRRGQGEQTGGGYGQGPLEAHVAQGKTKDQHRSDTIREVTETPGLMTEQIQRLLSLINVPKSGCDKLSGKSEWILDSGAS